VRLATFNLENLDDAPGDAPPFIERLRVLRPQLDRVAADVLCLQEVNAQRDGPKGGPRRLRALDGLLAGTRYSAYQRVCSQLADGGGPLDVHNTVILSRLPILWSRQYWHDLMPPPDYAPVTADPPGSGERSVRWDRPVLHAALSLGDGRALHVLNLHLRASLAAFVPGQKQGQFVWKTASGWAEGFFIATMKRSGQALEARLVIDGLFDDDPEALIALCGDLNAELREMPLRILRGDEEDTANGALAGRVMIPLEHAAPESRRYSVLHGGLPSMLDHLLVSRSLLRHFRCVEIHNEALEDELVGYAVVKKSPESYHAPVVAVFDL
jgi:endonuclease/exonuclease/phosphatase family metal-dependent hydrolase